MPASVLYRLWPMSVIGVRDLVQAQEDARSASSLAFSSSTIKGVPVRCVLITLQ